MATRVFVRLYDGSSQREGDGELLMLPPPPLTWKGVMSMMIMAVTKQQNEPDDQSIARARLFLVPTTADGIVAELNARALRFGVRDNDVFAICLNGEEYKKPASPAATPTATVVTEEIEPQGVTATDAAAALTTMSSLNSGASAYGASRDYSQSYSTTNATSNGPPRGDNMFTSTSNGNGPPRGNMYSASNGNAPPSGNLFGDANGGGNRKANKRYRSISGKMAAIKSLTDKGLISAEDRGHLKDLLLNNDSSGVQDALDLFQNTGDFQAVQQLLMKELRNPSTKRGTADWLPESLINELSANFQTHDDGPNDQDEQIQATDSYGNRYAQSTMVNDGYMYPTNAGTETTSVTSDYTAVAEGDAVHPTGSVNDYQYQQQNLDGSWTASGVYAQQTTAQSPSEMDMQGYATTNHGMNHRGMQVMRPPVASPVGQPSQYAQQASMMHGNPMEIGYTTSPVYGVTSQGYTPMGYATAVPASAADYSRMTPGGAYYGTPVYGQAAYSPYYTQQQSPMGYGMASPYGQQYAMQGYDYYGATAAGGYAYMRAGQMAGRMSAKWTTAPAMPAFPPACSKEEKKEKIARWLKKRENRNWSNKPSYPVRHNIAKNRKRGEDGRFITKKRLAEMELEEKARIAAGLPPTVGGINGDNDGANDEDDEYNDHDDDASGSDPETSTMPLDMLNSSNFIGLPEPVHT